MGSLLRAHPGSPDGAGSYKNGRVTVLFVGGGSVPRFLGLRLRRVRMAAPMTSPECLSALANSGCMVWVSIFEQKDTKETRNASHRIRHWFTVNTPRLQ